ncbi:MAG TPA: MFS transporter, partial [Candidatus Eisenbacteria bacterium]|nr:MFS transporter [Candidatus Eisenbacteria bacterium]
HGAAAGAYWPAANGLLAHVTPAEDRGRAFGMMQSTMMAGMLIGPAIGGFIALYNLSAVFVVSACVCAVAIVALALLPNVRAEPMLEVPVGALHIARKLAPMLVLGAGTSYMIGSFDTIWPLYMTHRGANTFAVGLSFVAFALPATLLSARAGALGDRIGPRRVVVAALIGTAFFSSLYPFITSVPWLIGLGLVEGALTISGGPSLIAEVSRTAEPGHQARTQGVFQTVQTLIQIVGALAGGALFALSPTFAFLAIAAVCLLGASTVLVSRRARTQPAAQVR